MLRRRFLSARAVRDFALPACRPSVSPPAFVVIVAVAKAIRSLDSLVYPLRCVLPVYILFLCARCRSLPFSIVVASVDCGAVSALASVLLVSPVANIELVYEKYADWAGKPLSEVITMIESNFRRFRDTRTLRPAKE